MTEYLATGFAGLDRTGDPDVYVRCLRYLGGVPAMRAIKEASLERLAPAPGARVLEVGCGLGAEAAALAHRVGSGVSGGAGGAVGLAVGLDASQTMLAQAAREQPPDAEAKPVFAAGDGARLPFAAGAFDACRIERTLQHVPDPGAVLAEMGRATRSGGAVLAVEPDWGAFVVDSDFENVSRRLAHFWCDSFRCGWIGRRLGRLMAEAGLVGVEILPRSLVLQSLEAAEAVYSLLETADRAAAAGAVSQAEAAAFAAEQRRRDAAGTFFCSLTFFMAVGHKP